MNTTNKLIAHFGKVVSGAGIAVLLATAGPVNAGPSCDKNPSHPSCSGGGGGGDDTTPPSLIDDFHAERTTSISARLYWSAPGDDGDLRGGAGEGNR